MVINEIITRNSIKNDETKTLTQYTISFVRNEQNNIINKGNQTTSGLTFTI